MRKAVFAVAASGTATLQLALCRTPMIVVYRLNYVTYRLFRMLARTPYVSLPNILLNRHAVRELIQHQATPQAICREVSAALAAPGRMERIRRDLDEAARRLGPAGASTRLAALVCRQFGIAPTC